MKYITDLQGYWIQRKFIVKTLTFFCSDINACREHVFGPIVPLESLSEKNQRVVSYYDIIKNIHS